MQVLILIKSNLRRLAAIECVLCEKEALDVETYIRAESPTQAVLAIKSSHQPKDEGAAPGEIGEEYRDELFAGT